MQAYTIVELYNVDHYSLKYIVRKEPLLFFGENKEGRSFRRNRCPQHFNRNFWGRRNLD